MPAFWILATSMTLVALAFVLVPLLYARRGASSAPTAAQANLEALRRQRRELEADVVNGTLPADAHDEALAELVQRADADLAVPAAISAPPAKRPWIVAAIVAVALPAIAFGTYLAVGTPAASDARLAAKGPAMGDAQILAMVESLARKVRERPDDPQGVALLARSMAALGRFREAADSYERLAKLVPNDPDVLADYADALGMAQGRTLGGRPAELVRQALALDPRHKKALALAGTAAMEAGDLPAATRYWESLARELPPGSPDEAEVREILADIRSKTGSRAPSVARAPAPSAPLAMAGAPLAAGQSVSGSVTLAPQVAGKVTGSETVFVFARAEGGSRMPLAVLRGSARELPLQFSLDDTMAMAPSSRLSLAEKVRIEARVSRSGNATPQPGDLIGTSDVVKPGARGVKIVVDKVLP